MDTTKTAIEIFVRAAPTHEQGLADTSVQELASAAKHQAERYLGVAALDLAEPMGDVQLPTIRAGISLPSGPTGTYPDLDQTDDIDPSG